MAYMKAKCFLPIAVILLSFQLQTMADSARIFADGNFDDWAEIDPLYSDTIGDQLTGSLDFGQLWVVNDENYLFLCLEVGEEINLQDDNDISLFLDTDNNSSTGFAINGLGAELRWNFGDKNGAFYIGSSSYNIYHENIGLVTCPTVSGSRFEMVIERGAEPYGGNPLFTGDSFKIVFKDYSAGSDMLPNPGEFISYTFDNSPLPPLTPLTLEKEDTNHVRLLSYNVHRDDLFDPEREESYERIFNAIQPDIIAFQEIYDHTSAQTADLISDFLPLPIGQDWYHDKVNPDIIVVSRFPIQEVYPIDGNGAFLIDLNPNYDSQLLLIDAHLPSSSNNSGRQAEIDHIMSFIREAKSPGGALELEENTPIIITGDLNLVGYAQQLETLLTGNIVNTSQYGEPFPPDWDESDFADLTPRHTHTPHFFTWFSESSTFSPGRLDFVIYSDYVAGIGNSFVLFTPEMPPETLTLYNLQPEDVTFASDHLPTATDIHVFANPGLEPINDLVLTIEGDNVVLSWTAPLNSAGFYRVYRSSEPYFTPSSASYMEDFSGPVSGSVSWFDAGALLQGNSYFYFVTYENQADNSQR